MCQYCDISGCGNGCGCDTTEQDVLERQLESIEKDYQSGMIEREEAIKQVRRLIDGKYEAEDELKLMGIIVEEWE